MKANLADTRSSFFARLSHRHFRTFGRSVRTRDPRLRLSARFDLIEERVFTLLEPCLRSRITRSSATSTPSRWSPSMAPSASSARRHSIRRRCSRRCWTRSAVATSRSPPRSTSRPTSSNICRTPTYCSRASSTRAASPRCRTSCRSGRRACRTISCGAQRIDYGRASHTAERTREGIVFASASAGTAMRLRTSVPVEIDAGDATARFTLLPGESASFVLELLTGDGDSPCGREHYVAEAFKATTNFWRAWSGRAIP